MDSTDAALSRLRRPDRYPRSATYDQAWVVALDTGLVGWEALAWHTAEWWRFGWEVTGLVTDVTARLQGSGWEDWLIWAGVGGSQPTVDMLRNDGGELLTFALVSARKR